MAETDKALQDLDDLFAQARADRPDLPEGLAAAILSDAAMVQADLLAPGLESGTAAGGFWLQLRQALGGWPAMGGLVAASAAGLWIGFTDPSYLPDPVTLIASGASTETVPFDTYDLAVMLAEDLQ